jgi:hypothetical protein
MPVPPPHPGWSRFLVKSKFGAGRDFIVSDPETDVQRYFVDGKLGPRPNAGGAEVATLKSKTFSPIKSRMTLEMAAGEPWTVEGSLMEKNYTPSAAREGRSSRSARSG